MHKTSPKKVFISYRWESESHDSKVIKLTNSLLENGIDCQLDKRKYALSKGNINWSAWVDSELPSAEFILVICTENYKNCFDNKEACTGEGGVQYEANLIRLQVLKNNILPIIFDSNDKVHIPVCMASFSRYELFEMEFDVNDEKSGFHELVRKITNQAKYNFSDLGQIPVLPPINDEGMFTECLNKMTKQYQFITDYLTSNAIHKDELIEVCKKYLKKVYIDTLVKYQNIADIISHISNFDQFPYIIRELITTDDQNLTSWLKEQKLMDNLKIENIENTSKVVIIFTSRHIDQRFNVTFISKNLPNIPDSKSDEDYDLNDPNSKNMLIDKVISYVQIANPIVDLILPKELLGTDINLWEINFNESLSRLSRLNIRDINRYNMNDSMKDTIKNEWNLILNKVSNNQTLRFIKTEACLKNIGNNMNECGIASKYLLEEKHFNYLLKTQMSYIMLWFTRESEEDLSNLYSINIKDIQNEYYKLQNSPINLMWDDPTTYYYPDEREGKTNE
jgi:hypothetical protein